MSCFVTGTDTDVGKTIVCSWLMLHYPRACYWKPIQAGLEEQDIDAVSRVTNIDQSRFCSSSYELITPVSPHEAARREGIKIEVDLIQMPALSSPLIVEGAGGLLVPLNKKFLIIDLIKKFNLPVILVARTGLGTINHTLMSLEVMRAHGLTVLGVVMNGEPVKHNSEAIQHYGKVKILGEIPHFSSLDIKSLKTVRPKVKIKELM